MKKVRKTKRNIITSMSNQQAPKNFPNLKKLKDIKITSKKHKRKKADNR